MRRPTGVRVLAAALACAATLGTTAGAGGPRAAASAAAAPEPAPAAAFPTIAILAYHDVSRGADAGPLTVSPEFLASQIRDCRARGWTFLPLAEVLAHREHPERLPGRVLVLTFDDGYRSALELALPILRAEGVPATFAPITSFAGTSPPGMPALLGWDGLRTLARSPGVELASHSHALHQFEQADPHGGTSPSTSARRWLPALGRYEDREEYRARIGADLAESRRRMRERLGVAPGVLVWPYGAHNEMARAQAAGAGYSATLALGQRTVTAEDLRSGCLPRYLVHRGMAFDDGAQAWLHDATPPVRAAEVDLDALWDADEARFRARIETAVTRVRALGATHVILPVCADPQRDGRLLRSYVMNHQLPVLAEAWTLAAGAFRAAGLKVWAQVPSLSLTWTWERHPEWRVPASGWRAGRPRWSTRLSPDFAGVRAAAVDFMADLAVYLPLDGVMFDDDATLASNERLAGNGSWDADVKARAIRELLEECKRTVRAWRPECRFARAVPLAVVGRAGASREHAVDLDECFLRDELVFLRVPAPARGASVPALAGGLERSVRRAVDRWRALGHHGEPPIVAMLPALDAQGRHWLTSERQLVMADAVRKAGLAHLGTRPVAAEGELPIGLLEARASEPAVRSAGRR
jgi:biofilm PGA synthesis lipoprotein PgaB